MKNNRRIWILILVVVVILGIIFIPRLFFNEGDETVRFEVVDKADTPEKLQNLLPKYKAEERALACKIDDKVYIVVTRGEKNTAGYSVTIDKIEKIRRDDKFDLIVYALYKDPKPDEIVAQVITYPTIIVLTDLKELPETIQLKTEYIE